MSTKYFNWSFLSLFFVFYPPFLIFCEKKKKWYTNHRRNFLLPYFSSTFWQIILFIVNIFYLFISIFLNLCEKRKKGIFKIDEEKSCCHISAVLFDKNLHLAIFQLLVSVLVRFFCEKKKRPIPSEKRGQNPLIHTVQIIPSNKEVYFTLHSIVGSIRVSV